MHTTRTSTTRLLNLHGGEGIRQEFIAAEKTSFCHVKTRDESAHVFLIRHHDTSTK